MSAARGLLVTGTDTGVGKTFVAAAIARSLSERLRIAPFKPAETGCKEKLGELWPEDAVALRAAARSSASLDLICPYRYAEPLAPWMAAERAGRPIDPARLRECFAALRAEADFVLAESAGGLLVPLTRTYSFADLAAELVLPLLLVVGNRLGAINQALLTLEYARMRGLEVRGYVLNEIAPGADIARETNGEALRELTDVPCLATIPWQAEDPSALLSKIVAA